MELLENHAVELILLSLIAGSAYCQWLSWVMEKEEERGKW